MTVMDEVIPGQMSMDDWRHEGNPDITVWCPVCECRTLAIAAQRCMWCDHDFREEPQERFRSEPASTAERIVDRLGDRELTVNDLGYEMPDVALSVLRSALWHMERRGRVRRVGSIPPVGSGSARTVWALA